MNAALLLARVRKLAGRSGAPAIRIVRSMGAHPSEEAVTNMEAALATLAKAGDLRELPQAKGLARRWVTQ